MGKWKNLILPLFMILGMSSANAEPVKSDQQIMWLASNFPPCHNLSQNSPPGYCDIVGEMIFSRVEGYEFVKEPSSFARHAASMKSGVMFCALDLLKTESRKKHLQYSLPIYPILPLGVVALAQNRLMQDIANGTSEVEADVLLSSQASLGVNRHRHYGDTLQDLFGEHQLHVKSYNSEDDASLFKMLTGKRIDGVFLNPVEYKMFIDTYADNDLTIYSIKGVPLIDTYVACSHSEETPELIDEINRIIRNIPEDTLREPYTHFLAERSVATYKSLVENRQP